MSESERTFVLRGETKYLEERIERVRASGFVDDVLTVLVEVEEKTITKKQIRIYDISTIENTNIADRLFYYGECFQRLRWKRNSKIEFEGTIYKLRKCKGKNDQKPGSKEIWEIRNPRNIKTVELDTDNRYRPKKKTTKKRRHNRTKEQSRRRELKALEHTDKTGSLPQDEKKYRQLVKKEWHSVRKQGRHVTVEEIEERIRERGNSSR